MKFRKTFKSVLSVVMATAMLLSSAPVATQAAQSNEYVDPATRWVRANGRTSEFDANATVTTRILFCPVCNINTQMTAYRVPEYTKTGETALNRSVLYSDGTCMDGVSKGNLDYGLPGEDAFYTGSHWTKTVCQNCGTVNASEGTGEYSFGKDVYTLNPCDYEFFMDFDHTAYTPYNSEYHITSLKKGSYCQFCKGTKERAIKSEDKHHIHESVDGQLGNQRFYVFGECEDCGYTENEYVAAKSVVGSYYGKVDGKAHTVTLSDLSEAGVKTSIRYGTEANKCNKTSAPNYTEEGYYPVYYEIEYTYGHTSMTENGVSYVWLLGTDISGDTGIASGHAHDPRYLETVAPTCTEMGYERWQCVSCGALEKRNYTAPTGHEHDEIVIREATCQQGGLALNICKNCGDHYTETTPVTDHRYKIKMVDATCVMNGYTEHICEDCGYKYITDLTPLAKHVYNRTVIEPTCKAKGYTINTCSVCDDTYISDYVSELKHDWDEGRHITETTCDSDGVIEYICKRCDDKMLVAESAKGHTPGDAATCTKPQTCSVCGVVLELPKEHQYHKTVYEPTCTSIGYTVYECNEGDHSYIADYKDKLDHDYESHVEPATCTAMGYTVYTCRNCEDEYISDYIDKRPHEYEKAVVAPTCTEMGHTTYKCKKCEDEYAGDYINASGHKPSEWIIDIPATIEHEGSKHIECLNDGEILRTETIPRLIAQDNSDEDGQSKVGNYSILITDKDGKPVFGSEVAIDANDNITIKLPEGRLIDYADRTTITVIYSDTQTPVEGIRIFASDYNNNAATGETDINGQLIIPNNQSSTGDDNGTIGGETDEKPYTYVVTVTDKDDNIISDCDIEIGDDNDIVVKLPDGTPMNSDNRVTVTVKDQNGIPKKDINVIVKGDSDYIEKGKTNANGQVTLPARNQARTDRQGFANVDGFIIKVEDEIEPVYNALVTISDDKVLVYLPEGKKIDYKNRTTVTVQTSDGDPVENMPVNIYDSVGGDRTENTDKNGKVTIPPWNENIIEDPTPTPAPSQKPGLEPDDPSETEKPGATEDPSASAPPSETAKPDGGTDSPEPTIPPDSGSDVVTPDYTYKISVRDNDGNVNGAIVSVDKDTGEVTVILPEGKTLSPDNRVIVGVLYPDDTPVKGVPVTVIAKDGGMAKDITNGNGIAIVPPINTDKTDKNGYAQVVEGENTYNVIVRNETENIENAIVTVKDGKLSVNLPDGKKLISTNQTTVIVTNADGKPISNLSITVTDPDKTTVTKATDSDGKIVVPAKSTSTGGGTSSGGGGGGGSSSGSSGGGGGGNVSSSSSYNITVTDKDGKTVAVTKSIKDGRITLTLPSGKTLDDGYYTITVKDAKGNVQSGVEVTLKDKKNREASGTTDKNGILVLPVNEHKAYVYGYETGKFLPEGNMTRAEASAIFARNIAERRGETIPSTKSSFKDVNSKLWYSGPIAYLEKYNVISGYSDGTFAPEEPISRAEFVAMCSRFYAQFNTITTAKSNEFTDVKNNHWAYKYINEAAAMDWVAGYADSTFRPDNNIKRAEVVAIVNRMTGRSADREYVNEHMSVLNPFTDLKDSVYWAFYDVIEAANSHTIASGSDSEVWVK